MDTRDQVLQRFGQSWGDCAYNVQIEYQRYCVKWCTDGGKATSLEANGSTCTRHHTLTALHLANGLWIDTLDNFSTSWVWELSYSLTVTLRSDPTPSRCWLLKDHWEGSTWEMIVSPSILMRLTFGSAATTPRLHRDKVLPYYLRKTGNCAGFC